VSAIRGWNATGERNRLGGPGDFSSITESAGMMPGGLTVIDVSQDIQSLTAFKRNSAGLVKRMRKTGRRLSSP
jgi:hypothetical protein